MDATAGPTRAERSLWGKQGALTSWGNTDDWSARTSPAREARWKRYLERADPTGTLDDATRIRKAKALQHADMVAMSAKAATARRRRRESTGDTALGGDAA